MIKVKNHQTEDASRIEAAFASISDPCWRSAPIANHIEFCIVN